MTSILNKASTTSTSLLLLPEGFLDYFDLTKVSKDAAGVAIFLEEKNTAPMGY